MEAILLKLLAADSGTLEWPVVVPHESDGVLKTLRSLGIPAQTVAHQGRPYLVSGPYTTSFELWKLHCAATNVAAAPALILTQRYLLAVAAAQAAAQQLAAAGASPAAASSVAAGDAPEAAPGPIPLDEWARRTRAFASAATVALRLPA